MTKIPEGLRFAEGERIETAEEEKKRAEKARKVRKLSPAERARGKRDRARKRAAYDLPVDVIDTVKAIAETESVSQSNLVARILAEWANTYLAGDVEFTAEDKDPAHHPRWHYKIDIPVVNGTVNRTVGK